MKIDIEISWDSVPEKGRLEVKNGKLLHTGVCKGTGNFDLQGNFSFSSKDPGGRCSLICLVDAGNIWTDKNPTQLVFSDKKNPLTLNVRDVIDNWKIEMSKLGLTITAEEHCGLTKHGPLPKGEKIERFDNQEFHMELYKKITKEQIKQFGPEKEYKVISTERHEYDSVYL